jgi:uncharacterized protein YjiS (DUF1127 family)
MLDLSPPPRGPVAALLGWFQRRRQSAELAAMDGYDTGRIAADLGISVDDLMAVAGQSRDDIDLMTRMLAEHGLSRASIEAELPELARGLALTCAKCNCKGECEHDLEAGRAKDNAARYCPNIETIQSLAGR